MLSVTSQTRYYHVVSVLGRSTATQAASFIANPPNQGKYRDLKAFLLKTFELSHSERAHRLLAIRGLGDSKPSEHMEMMLNLLGTEEPNCLFIALFLQHMPPQVRMAPLSFVPEVLAPTRTRTMTD